MPLPDLTPREKKLIHKANNNAGLIMFWALIVAVTVVTPIEIRKFYQIWNDPSSHIRDYFHPWLIVAIHIVLLRRIILYRKCLRVIKKLHDALPESDVVQQETTDSTAVQQKTTDPA